jgi:iron complex outermembrane receptor protein
MFHNVSFPTGRRNRLALSFLIVLSPCVNAETEETRELPEMTVEGETPDAPSAYTIELQQTPVTTADTAALLELAPGANVNRNGPLTGIAQYRGMYGDRVNVLVNGMQISTGGPNGMDPA